MHARVPRQVAVAEHEPYEGPSHTVLIPGFCHAYTWDPAARLPIACVILLPVYGSIHTAR
jgi:hypothetical protein